MSEKSSWARMWDDASAALGRKLGPAGIIGMTICGPGTISAVLTAAAGWSYSMMWGVLISAVFSVIGMLATAKVMVGTGKLSTEALSQMIHPAIAWLFAIIQAIIQFCVVMAEGNALATVAVNVFNKSGGGIFSFDIPFVVLAVVLTVLCAVVYFRKGEFRVVANLAWGLMTFMVACFLVGMFLAKPNWGQVFASLVPSWPPRFPGHLPAGQAPVALAGILGGAFGLYSFIYHPFALKEKGWTQREHVTMAFWDTVWANVVYAVFAVGLFVTFAATLYSQNLTPKGIPAAAVALEPLLGSFARWVFVLGWFAAVFTTTAGAAMIGWTPIAAMCGFKPTLKDSKFRAGLFLFTVIPGAVLGPALGQNAITFLVWAMAMLNLAAPLGVAAWLYMGNRRELVDMKFSPALNVVLALALVVTAWLAYMSAPNILSIVRIFGAR